MRVFVPRRGARTSPPVTACLGLLVGTMHTARRAAAQQMHLQTLNVNARWQHNDWYIMMAKVEL